jgi:trehalose 6-phosphate synthase
MTHQQPDAYTGHEPLIVMASNRGPYSFKQRPDGSFITRRGDGGLVTALSAVAETQEVLWIAAALSKDDRAWAQGAPGEAQAVGDMHLRLLTPERGRYQQYYNVIANPLLWFIQHDLWDNPRQPQISRETWDAWREGYVAVNRKFAQTIIEAVEAALRDTPDRPVIIFPQDYHLYLVPRTLREHFGSRVQIQPFIHIPWPSPDSWRILPAEMRTAILESLLTSDRVGFQTKIDAFNFVQNCRLYLNHAHSHGRRDLIEYKGRRTEARAYPISIDVDKVKALTDDMQTRLIRRPLMNTIGGLRMILRIDRIEPSKNILRGMMAFRALLESHPEHRGKVMMLALLVPSRLEVSEYQTYLQEIMAQVGMINAEYSDELYEPVRVIIGNNYPRAIAALQLYEVLLVNPIADGMNLVAKEGALVNEHGGVLVLSEHAGVVHELGDHALTISPYDIYSTAEALHHALNMPPQERYARAEAMHNQVVAHDVRAWFQLQLRDALNALRSASSQASTPGTPETSTSAEARTIGGVSAESTPTPKA